MGKQSVKKFTIIVAGGSGTRMNSTLPKQFLLLNGKPILMRTIEQFLKIEGCKIILVLPKSEQPYWLNKVAENHPSSEVFKNERITVANGGATRFQSVKNGLSAINSDEGIVAVHDGVRPVISVELIENAFAEAAIHGAVVTSVALKDSIREICSSGENRAVDRRNFRLIQTPQIFDIQLLKSAYEQEEKPSFTDDASVVEAMGENITLIEGDYKNIKITTPEDMIVAEAFLEHLPR